jgi:hypothetical protein
VIPGGSRTDSFQQMDQLGTIDSHLLAAMQEAGAAPAPRSDDYTFARRVSLDLTGRVPTYDRLIRFISDPASDKRARYIDELLETSTWVDKWTMFFGDLYKNTINNTQINIYPEGRNAFYNYLKSSLAANKRYNAMATELIAGSGTNNWEQGELNFNILGRVGGGPAQDIYDQQAANVAEMFLGISHENCVLCHDGRRRLDPLTLWGKQETRIEGWGLAAFFARSNMPTVRPDPAKNNRYYGMIDNGRLDYQLNTTTGNRPARQPIGSIRAVTPEYPFGGGAPNPGEPYRAALARLLTSDVQFARAAVNYLWKEFFGRGIVDPVNQFDPDRQDPDNPPPEPWTIQPTHPRLLNALAQDFIESGYDVKALMRQIVNSQAYQLASTYEGNWNPAWQNLFARKMVRRMWAEEVMDNIAMTSNVPNPTNLGAPLGILNWTMQMPDTRTPGGNTGSFLDSFYRGNRVDEDRRVDGSVPQTLNLMNDSFVHTRTRATGAGPSASIARQMLNKYGNGNNDALINELFLTIVSRPPTAHELTQARGKLAAAAAGAERQRKVEDLVWVLYNKVDFIYVL